MLGDLFVLDAVAHTFNLAESSYAHLDQAVATTEMPGAVVGDPPAPDVTASSTISQEAVRGCLDLIIDPCSVGARSPMSITEMGLIETIDISAAGVVDIRMRLTAPSCLMVGHFKTEATKLIGALAGVTDVTLRTDSGLDWDPSMITPDAQARRAVHLELLQARPLHS